MNRLVKLTASALALAALAGCSTVVSPFAGLVPVDAAKAASAAMPKLPWAGGKGDLTPWGGTNASRWRPEAILANAASEALNEAWARPGTEDAVVAVALKMYASDFKPYGDGQANAVPAFESWKESRPPVLATLVRAAGKLEVTWRFDRALHVKSGAFELRVGDAIVPLAATQEADGDWKATWKPSTELNWESPTSPATVLVRPQGWADWFPIGFRHAVRPIRELEATVPASLRRFKDGGGIVDHEGVGVGALKSPQRRVMHVEDGRLLGAGEVAAMATGDVSPFQALLRHDFGGRYNQTPFEPDNIHARFPYGGHDVVTAVGKGWTWVAEEPGAPFKILYTAFQRRQADREASAPDGGVPSGGGWHLIGDPAETILNSVESAPIVVGSATNEPRGKALPSGAYAYGLSDVATVRWLRPGEAFSTKRGPAGHANYHWFIFQQNREVVTEEWVHPKVPNDRGDF